MGITLIKREEPAKTDIRKTRTCERCKVQVPLANVRLFAQNEQRNLILCEPCCDILKKKEGSIPGERKVVRNVYQPRSLLSQNHSKTPVSKIELDTPKILNRPQMSCARCDYAFTMSEPKSGNVSRLSCPYCGKSDRLQRIK